MLRLTSEFDKLKFLYLDKIRISHPSEWNGLTEGGDKIYVNYNHGIINIGRATSFEAAKNDTKPALKLKDFEDVGYVSTEMLKKILNWKVVIISPQYTQEQTDD